jgi:hypothetical protein
MGLVGPKPVPSVKQSLGYDDPVDYTNKSIDELEAILDGYKKGTGESPAQ